MKGRIFLTLAVFAALIPASPQAGVVPGRWEKIDRLPSGQQIIVTLNSLDRIEGKFKNSGPDSLTLTDPSGVEKKVAKSEVRKIVSGARVKDSLNDGALIGMGVGLGVALALLAAAASGDDSEVLTSAKWGAPLLGIGAGLGVGIAIDASQKRAEVLYQSP